MLSASFSRLISSVSVDESVKSEICAIEYLSCLVYDFFIIFPCETNLCN